ncbi:MAG: hypothetical protein LBC82_07895 [Oscillospiraceae bacterium]|jgi:hypothetical protein|nr:hypothetical protein [Oscillospiraceae bacterium]
MEKSASETVEIAPTVSQEQYECFPVKRKTANPKVRSFTVYATGSV